MVKHIVLFKFKKTGDIASVKATMREFKSALEALKDKIPFLRFIEVGINENPKEDFDMCLVTEFNGRSGKLCSTSRPCGSDPNYKRYKGGKGLCRLHILMEFFRFFDG